MANADFSFPYKGLDKGQATSMQPGGTSPGMNNMRVYDVLDNRARGGQRPGLDKQYAQLIGGDAYAFNPIIELLSISIAGS